MSNHRGYIVAHFLTDIFLETADAFYARRRGDHIVSIQNRSRTSVVAMKSYAAAEKSKDQLSRDFWGCSIFDFQVFDIHLGPVGAVVDVHYISGFSFRRPLCTLLARVGTPSCNCAARLHRGKAQTIEGTGSLGRGRLSRAPSLNVR